MNKENVSGRYKNKGVVESSRCQGSKNSSADSGRIRGTAAVMRAVDWKLAVSASVLAGVLSLLTSIAGLPECNTKK